MFRVMVEISGLNRGEEIETNLNEELMVKEQRFGSMPLLVLCLSGEEVFNQVAFVWLAAFGDDTKWAEAEGRKGEG